MKLKWIILIGALTLSVIFSCSDSNPLFNLLDAYVKVSRTIPTAEGAADVRIKNNYAYIALQSGGIQVFDLQNIENITCLTTIYRPEVTCSEQLFIKENGLYVRNLNDSIDIYDISYPSRPVHLTNYTIFGYHVDMLVHGPYLLLLDSAVTSSIDIINVSPLGTAQYIESIPLSPGQATRMASVKTNLYVSFYQPQIDIISLSSSALHSNIKTIPTENGNNHVCANGDYLTILNTTSFKESLSTFQITSQTNIKMIHKTETKSLINSNPILITGNNQLIYGNSRLYYHSLKDGTPDFKEWFELPENDKRSWYHGAAFINDDFFLIAYGGLYLIDASCY